ncbi:hypothetical protein KQ51_00643 [Candidatus Izimaplasma bacterium HR1]|jgi:hypothetical protein|uniref:hypothetical protein n=1 Tax=Candidatus Izimoplasma sp. HR1 TaxID=1541959 RepID=UPI0004F589DE|nr:hypothetical protein KQ51_00643 [Candidatus Izimaplasma bacterium HR1]
MDYYDNGASHQGALRNIVEKQGELITKSKKVIRGIELFAFLSALFACLIMYLSTAKVGFYAIPIGVGSLITLLTHLIVPSVYKGKLVKEVVNKEVINLYNYENSTNFDYLDKIKVRNNFNKEMGLFTRLASVSTRFQIIGEDINIMNCTLVTSNGKSSTVHFDGIYMIYKKMCSKTFQLRTKGRPKLKGVKFSKQEGELYSEFVPFESNEIIDSYYINIFESSLNSIELSKKKVYLGSNLKEIHFGYHPPKFMKYDEFTYEVFKEYYKYFSNILNLGLRIKEQLSDQ